MFHSSAISLTHKKRIIVKSQTKCNGYSYKEVFQFDGILQILIINIRSLLLKWYFEARNSFVSILCSRRGKIKAKDP